MIGIRFLLWIMVSSFVFGALADVVEVGDLLSGTEKAQFIEAATTSNDTVKQGRIYKNTKSLVGDKTAQSLQKGWNTLTGWFGGSDEPAVKNPTEESQEQVVNQEKKQFESQAEQLAQQLPDYKNPTKSEVKKQAQEAQKSIQSTDLIKVVKVGRKGKSIPRRWKRKVPALDVGVEPEIKANEFFIKKIKVSAEEFLQANPLKPPKKRAKGWKAKLKKIKIAKTPKEKRIDRRKYKLGKPVTKERILKKLPVIQADNPITEIKPVSPMSPEQLLLLATQIEYEKKDHCHIVLGLARQLLRTKSFKDDAKFYLGSCSYSVGLHSDRVNYLLPLVKKADPEYGREALEILVEKLPAEYISLVGPTLHKVRDLNMVSEAAKDDYNYIVAKSGYDQGLNKRAITFASKISVSSPHYIKAKYLVGVAQFNKSQFKSSRKTLRQLRKYMSDNAKEDKNIANLIPLTLARIAFQRQDYKNAILEYKKVKKTHSTWVQAMTELGWAQLALNDFSGAIGNMYSMHSPYFRAVYKPESWAVRAIGYLNICQYGDAYRSITQLERIHGSYLQRVSNYLAKNKRPSQFYSTIYKYLSGKSTDAVDGLPYQVVREMARQRNFLNPQSQINDKIDERARYNQQLRNINREISKAGQRIRKARQRLAKIKTNLLAAKTNKKLIQNINRWQAERRQENRLIVGYRYQVQAYKEAKKGFRSLAKVGKKRMSKEEARLRVAAGKALRTNLREMRSQMRNLLANNEFLRFEAFSGAGENIRYLVSGGKSSGPNRIPAKVRPKKILNWEFEGEFWEDEIGSYRSSLKNNCPERFKSTARK